MKSLTISLSCAVSVLTLSILASPVVFADAGAAATGLEALEQAPAQASAVELLHLVSPATSTLSAPVDVQFAIDGDELKAHFEVRTKEIFAHEHLAKGEYPYQFDVVELFVSVAGQASPFPYYEFEVSPYGETFQVKIPGGGKPFQDGIDVGSKAIVHRVKGSWSADLSIKLSRLGYDGDRSKLVGNAFAVLGKKPLRSYWSLSLPHQDKPNFHKPEFFRPLFAE